jgi:pteridine reductase
VKRVGAAIARRLADLGHDLVLTYRNSHAEAQEMARHLTASGTRVELVKSGGDPAADTAAIVAAAGRLGPVAVLVHSASVYQPDGENGGAGIADDAFATHAIFPNLLTRALAAQLKGNNGLVVSMGDGALDRPWPKYLTYGASKAALHYLALGWARELGPEARSVVIAPGVVDWPDTMPESERRAYLARVPLGRAGTPEDVANLVAFLVGEGKYVTGEVVHLDGGRRLT